MSCRPTKKMPFLLTWSKREKVWTSNGVHLFCWFGTDVLGCKTETGEQFWLREVQYNVKEVHKKNSRELAVDDDKVLENNWFPPITHVHDNFHFDNYCIVNQSSAIKEIN